MRNIPVFTGEFGAATLILQEIPGRGEAYCVVQWVQPGKTWEFLASHLPEPPAAPPQVRLLRMACLRSGVPETDAALWPLLPENGEEFLRIYNEGMSGVPAAMSLHQGDLPRLLDQGGGYFVHRDGALLGIGQVNGDTLLSLVSCRRGAGRDVAAALISVMQGETVELQVAESNLRARALYEKLGFLTVGAGECWWEI